MKVIVGCLIQWYEVDIVEGYLRSLRLAIDKVADTQLPITVLTYNYVDGNAFIETPVYPGVVELCIHQIKELHTKYNFEPPREVYTADTYPCSISQFRNRLNVEGLVEDVDLIIWGESDMIVPVEMLESIYMLWKTPEIGSKWIATFASCKMWDESWKLLEHPDFTVHPHSDSPLDWWSVNHTMNYQEMCDINSKAQSYEIKTLTGPNLKFNGCGLILTSEIIKAGVNVPPAAFFVHEDTAFLELLKRVFPDLVQYHFSNILLVHNRKDPNKRPNYLISGEQGQTVGQRRKSNSRYVKANSLSELNTKNLFNTKIKFYDWDDIL